MRRLPLERIVCALADSYNDGNISDVPRRCARELTDAGTAAYS